MDPAIGLRRPKPTPAPGDNIHVVPFDRRGHDKIGTTCKNSCDRRLRRPRISGVWTTDKRDVELSLAVLLEPCCYFVSTMITTPLGMDIGPLRNGVGIDSQIDRWSETHQMFMVK